MKNGEGCPLITGRATEGSPRKMRQRVARNLWPLPAGKRFTRCSTGSAFRARLAPIAEQGFTPVGVQPSLRSSSTLGVSPASRLEGTPASRLDTGVMSSLDAGVPPRVGEGVPPTLGAGRRCRWVPYAVKHWLQGAVSLGGGCPGESLFGDGPAAAAFALAEGKGLKQGHATGHRRFPMNDKQLFIVQS
jgi:hypothetical protein